MSQVSFPHTTLDLVIDGPIGKYTLDEFKALLAVNDFSLFGRVPEMCEKYYQRSAEALATYNGFEDRMFATLFSCPTHVDPETGKLFVKDEDKKTDAVRNARLFFPNEFNYALVPGLSHTLLWSGSVLSQEEATALVREKFPVEEYDYVYFENPPAYKTIPWITHWHIIGGKKGEYQTHPEPELVKPSY